METELSQFQNTECGPSWFLAHAEVPISSSNHIAVAEHSSL